MAAGRLDDDDRAKRGDGSGPDYRVTKRGRQFAHEGLFPPGKWQKTTRGNRRKIRECSKTILSAKEDEAIDTLGRHLEFSPEDALAHNDLGVPFVTKDRRTRPL